ncbi:MAG: hypothetical protein HKN72_01895 [Gemmatimonadetes bacterium]|nr:hypothetical protein [Gemmatimonadota bacterium]
MKAYKLIPVAGFFLAACGGGESADAPTSDDTPTPPPAAAPAGPEIPGGELSMPGWYQVDHDAMTVTLDIEAGSTADNNYWNYNGATNGEWAITVPVGYTVTVNLSNSDPNMAHSLGISRELTNFAVPPAPEPVFEGAITQNPQSMVDATMPGESETVTFVASEAGDYSMVCYIAGHTAVGMWLYFVVAEGQDAGVAGM